MTEPRTAAGRALLGQIKPGSAPFLTDVVPAMAILAIEAEARAAALDEARTVRLLLEDRATEAHVFAPDHPPVLFEACTYEPCEAVHRALAAIDALREADR